MHLRRSVNLLSIEKSTNYDLPWCGGFKLLHTTVVFQRNAFAHSPDPTLQVITSCSSAEVDTKMCKTGGSTGTKLCLAEHEVGGVPICCTKM